MPDSQAEQLSYNPLLQEVWVKVNGFDCYEISDFGNLRSLSRTIKGRYGKPAIRSGRPMKLSIDSRGYNQTHLFKDGVKFTFSVHRLVAEHFIANTENKPEVNHKKGIKTDNRATELEWATHQENIDHAVSYGLMKRGAQLPYSKTILDLATGIFYESVKEASFSRCINPKTLHNWLCGSRKNKSSLIFV